MSAVVNSTVSDVRYNPQNAWNLDTPATPGTAGSGTTAGAGSIAGVTAVPDPAAPTVMMAMMASVDAIMPKMGGEDLDALITSFTSKLKDTIDKSDKDQVKNQQDVKRGQIAEKKEKYKEAAQKIEDAKDAFAKASPGDKIKLAFQYIGAIMTIIAGIAAMIISAAFMVVTVGAATPGGVAGMVGGALLITSGLIMLTMAADQTVSMATTDENGPGMGMFGRMVKACAKANGQSDEEADKMAQKGAMGITIGLMVIAAVTGFFGTVMQPENAAEEVLGMVDEATQMIGTVVEIADEATNLGGDISTLSTVATAAAEVSSAVYNNEAADDQADAKRAQADSKSIEALGKTLDDFIDMAIARLKGSAERFSAMVDSAQEAIQDRADTMSRARLTG